MIFSSISFTPGVVFVSAWIVSMLLACYIFSTRTFKLSSDRYFLFIGSSVPGIIILEAFHGLAMPGFQLIPDPSGVIWIELEAAASAFLALVILIAPRAARLKVHRYVWTAVSISVGTVVTALIIFTDTRTAGSLSATQVAVGRAMLEGLVALAYIVAMIQLCRAYSGRGNGEDAHPARVGLKVMIFAVAIFLGAQVVALASCFIGDWLFVVERLLEAAACYVIVEGLVHRGLVVPVKLITRSRAQLEAAVSAAADGLLISDLSGHVIAMNWRFLAVVGTDANSHCTDASVLLDRVVREVIAPDALKRRMQQFLTSPDSEGFERIEMKDGRIFEVYSIPYLFEDRIDGRVWSLRDVSVRERTTAQLERSNWRLDNILTSAGDGLFEINLERGVLWLHANWKNVVGCDVAAVPATWDEFKAMIHTEDLPAVVRAIRQPYSTREYRVEFRMQDKAGLWRWYLCVGQIDRIESGGGRPEWVLNGVQRDITAEKTQEVEIRRQRGLMEALIENMPLGAFVKEMPSGRYVIWNSSLARLSGIPASQIFGRTDVESLPDEMARRSVKSDEDVVSQGVSVVIENSWLGEEVGRNIRLRKVPVIDADRSVKLIIGIVEDVTQQQQVERLVHQTRSLEALGRLAGGIAHDFNNILQVIIGSADALKLGEGFDQRAPEEVDQILEAGERARTLIRQLLTFSRQDSSTRESVDVDTVVSGLLKMLQRLIGADIAVSVRSSGARLLVNAEKSRLEQVFMNLTVNAVDAMPYGGSLTISTSAVDVDGSMTAGHPRAQVGRYALVAVGDSGIGIPRDVLDHMWEPFFSTKEVGKGTGLGLSTVYGIVEGLGGFIQVHSEMGHGTEFRVFLPLHASSGEVSVADIANPPRPVAEPRTILVAHQNQDALAQECKALEKAGFRVICASSGPEALQRLWEADETGGVKLLILDVVMAGMGGRDICDRYRMDHLEVPVIFCAEAVSPVIEEEYLEYVHGRLLRVPYSQRQLILAVRALLPR